MATLEERQIPNTKKEQTHPKRCWPFQIGENAYKLDLPANYGISNTFNVGNLAKGEQQELRTIMSKEGGDDPSIRSCSTIQAHDLTNLINLSAKEDLTAILHGPSTTGPRRVLHITHLD